MEFDPLEERVNDGLFRDGYFRNNSIYSDININKGVRNECSRQEKRLCGESCTYY